MTFIINYPILLKDTNLFLFSIRFILAPFIFQQVDEFTLINGARTGG